jgi:tetratricopeptide (TPR) repeat protein
MIPLDPVAEAVQDAKRLASEGELDEAMQKASSILQSHPQTLDALILRGNIYVDQKKWDLAEKDYAAALQIDGTNFTVKLNSAEIKFRQKNYDGARADFATLENDPDFGDLATYKVFLCDLFGGHEVAAKKELDAFNLAGTNPSYYFGNLAWALVHKNDVDARDWLASIDHIFTPRKILLYGSSLKDLGYLPLPKPTDS